MATMDSTQVTVGAARATGAIWVAPKGTVLPTDAVTELGEEFELLGFTSDAGVTISESSSDDTIKAWEARTTVYTVKTEYTESVSFTPIQCNADVAQLIWGPDYVEVDEQTGAIHAKHHGRTMEPVCCVIETVPREGIVKRFCMTTQLTERGEVTMDGTQVDGRQLTFNNVADADGITMHEYTAFTDAAPAPDPSPDDSQGDDTPDFASMTKTELVAYAAENNIEGVSESMTRDEIIAAIEAAIAEG